MWRTRKAAAKSLALFEGFEVRQLMSASVASSTVRSVDGSGNNLAHTTWAAANTDLIRKGAAAYADGISTPTGSNRPSARAVSNTLDAQGDVSIPDERDLSAYMYAWGQFIDHDLDLTEAGTTESMPIAVPNGDPQFDPTSSGTATIDFSRSLYDKTLSASQARQQITEISGFLDGSQVYGSDPTRAAALRTFSNGLLKTSAGNLLPFNTAGLKNATAGGPDSMYYLAGDIRANENIELTSIQVLFMREHNRIATQLAAKNPAWSDEQLYQQARKIVGAEIEAITFNEYLPALMGKNAIAAYTGYKSNVNPSISTEFSTVAFRFGHSQLEDDIDFLDNNGNDVTPSIDLSQAFFNPTKFGQVGPDPLLKYLASANSEQNDLKAVDSIRNFLFGPPGAGGFDLMALDIQRARDHGIEDYNSMRAAYGLPKVTSFAQITSDKTVQAELKQLYGNVNNIDAFAGGLAEDHVAGSALGPLFQKVLIDQFTRTRDGDRFWYQNDLSPADVKMVQNTSLADIIRRNSNVSNIQDNVFVFHTSISGRVFLDMNGNGQRGGGDSPWVGATVKLLDGDGNLVQQTTSGRNGFYQFNDMDLGTYQVTVEDPGGWKKTTHVGVDVHITRGMDVTNVNIGFNPGWTGGKMQPAAARAPIASPFSLTAVQSKDPTSQKSPDSDLFA